MFISSKILIGFDSLGYVINCFFINLFLYFRFLINTILFYQIFMFVILLNLILKFENYFGSLWEAIERFLEVGIY